MALFDFLKRKKKQEKEDARKAEKKETSQDSPAHEHEEGESSKPTSFSNDVAIDEFVLETPHVTERARMLSEIGQYTFRGHSGATKAGIKKSVEKLYGVHVTDIRITKTHEKKRRRGLTEGVKKGYKKAVVALQAGEAIDIF